MLQSSAGGASLKTHRGLLFGGTLACEHLAAVRNRAVDARGTFIGGQVGADVFHHRSAGADVNAQVSRTSLNRATSVTVLSGAARVVVAGVAGLGDLLVDEPVEVLLHVQVVMAVENNGNLGFER